MLKTVIYAIGVTLSTLAFLYFGGYDRQKEVTAINQNAFQDAGLIAQHKGLSDEAMGRDGMANGWFGAIAGFGDGPKQIKVEGVAPAEGALPKYTILPRQGVLPESRQTIAKLSVEVVDEGAAPSEID